MLPASAMPAPSPTFSVIVPCKDARASLPETLGSVWSQRGEAPELIVVDGGSADGTREWLEARRARLGTLVCEPDRGVYEAMNKGIAAARGDWILFLGADDRLAGDSVLEAARPLLGRTEGGVAVGEAAYDDGRVYRLADPPRPAARNFAHHQGAFYRRRLFAEFGGFDATLAIMADYDLNLRLWMNRVRFEALRLRVAVCGRGGLSDRGDWRGYEEEIRVRRRHFPASRRLLWDVLSCARFARKRIVRAIRA